MTGAGLKKWRPATRSGFGRAAARSVTDRAEVLVRTGVCSPTTAAASASSAFFTSAFSVTDSITTSTPARSAMLVVPVMRASTACLASSVTLPRATPPSRNSATAARPASTRDASVSRATTSRPEAANTCAIPAPIVPRPSTPTLGKSFIVCLLQDPKRRVSSYV